MPPSKSPWVLYILVSDADGSFYIGITTNLLQRVLRHNSGDGAKRTRGRGPWTLVSFAACENVRDALQKEKKAKRLKKKEKLAFFASLQVQA
jgi:putative endonuclease